MYVYSKAYTVLLVVIACTMGLSALLFIAGITFNNAIATLSLLDWVSFVGVSAVMCVAIRRLMAMRDASKRAVSTYRQIMSTLRGIGFKRNGFVGTRGQDGGMIVVRFTNILGYRFYEVWHIATAEDGTMTKEAYEFPAGTRGLVPRKVEIVATEVDEDGARRGTFPSTFSLFDRKGPRALAYADEYDLVTVNKWMNCLKADKPEVS